MDGGAKRRLLELTTDLGSVACTIGKVAAFHVLLFTEYRCWEVPMLCWGLTGKILLQCIGEDNMTEKRLLEGGSEQFASGVGLCVLLVYCDSIEII